MATGPINVDVKTIIQELVNRPGWVSGNSVNLRARDEAYVASNGTLIGFADYPSTGYGTLQVSYTEYPGHNMVLFDGVNDYMRRGSNIFASNPKSMVIYVDFYTPEALDSTGFMCAGALTNVDLKCSGTKIVFSNLLGIGLTHNSTTSLTASTHYRLVLSLQADTVDSAADGVCKMWLSANGGAWIQETMVSFSMGDSTSFALSGGALTNFTLFAHPSTATAMYGNVNDVSKVDGAQVGFFGLWASTSRTGAIITDPSVFFSAGKDRNLSIDLTVGGLLPTPLVAYGGTQTAADWNAGTNQGSAGNFTMSGGV